MIKSYLINKDISKWLNESQQEIFDNILEECEAGLKTGNDKITVAEIQTLSGLTLFNVIGYSNIQNSLHKCEMYYVEQEEYEKAGRALRCKNQWADQEIYKKYNQWQ